MEAFPISRVSHMAREHSGHSPLLIKCASTSHVPSCFHFQNMWCHHLQFQEVVSEIWGSEVHGVGMTKFFNKLKALRKKLQSWNREVFGNVTSKAKTAEQVFKQRKLESDLAHSEEVKLQLQAAQAIYLTELSIESAFWCQKARVKWLQEGDANTTFFSLLSSLPEEF